MSAASTGAPTFVFPIAGTPHRLTVTVPDAPITGAEVLSLAKRLRALAGAMEQFVLAKTPTPPSASTTCTCPGCVARRAALRTLN